MNLHFLHHSDVPYFYNSIWVARADQGTTNGKIGIVDWVQMTVESLNGQSCSHIPNAYRFVAATWNKEISPGLEVNAVDWVCMSSIGLAHLFSIEIKQLHWCVHRSAKNEVACVVKLCCPDRSCVFEKSCGAAWVDKVPDLYWFVSRPCN